LILSNQNILNDTSKQAEVKTGVSMTAEFQPDASHQRPERSEAWQVVGVGPHDKLKEDG
jgi:hypothetical protein